MDRGGPKQGVSWSRPQLAIEVRESSEHGTHLGDGVDAFFQE
jgi:hypothetical protein